jgi:preprotein translocase subunit SecB
MVKEKNVKSQLLSVIKATELAAIYLQGCNSSCLVFPTMVNPKNTNLDFTQNVTWSLNDKKDIFICFVTGRVKGNAESKEQFEIQATFALSYKLHNPEFSKEALTEFAERNAVYNAFPYLREALSNLSTRMGIPPVTLPLLKPPIATNSEAQQISD